MRYREINIGSKKRLKQKGSDNEGASTDRVPPMAVPEIELLKGQLKAEEADDRPTRRRSYTCSITR